MNASLVQVNPAVLGGVVVDFGDKTIDLSVVSRVNKLNGLLQRTSMVHIMLCTCAQCEPSQNPYELWCMLYRGVRTLAYTTGKHA